MVDTNGWILKNYNWRILYDAVVTIDFQRENADLQETLEDLYEFMIGY